MQRRTTVCISCRKVFRDVWRCPRCQKSTTICGPKLEVPSPKKKKEWDRFWDRSSPETFLKNKRR